MVSPGAPRAVVHVGVSASVVPGDAVVVSGLGVGRPLEVVAGPAAPARGLEAVAADGGPVLLVVVVAVGRVGHGGRDGAGDELEKKYTYYICYLSIELHGISVFFCDLTYRIKHFVSRCIAVKFFQ